VVFSFGTPKKHLSLIHRNFGVKNFGGKNVENLDDRTFVLLQNYIIEKNEYLLKMLKNNDVRFIFKPDSRGEALGRADHQRRTFISHRFSSFLWQ